MNKCCTKCSGGAYPCANTNCNCHAIQKQSTPSEQSESCHCGKDGHPLGSMNCPMHGYDIVPKNHSTKDISDKDELCVCGAKKSNDWHSVPAKPEVSTWEDKWEETLNDCSFHDPEYGSLINLDVAKDIMSEAISVESERLRAELVEKVAQMEIIERDGDVSFLADVSYNRAIDEVIKVIQEKGNSDD